MTDTGLLSAVPLFSGLPSADVEELSGMLRVQRCRKGEVIFHRGDAGSSLFIISSGTVKIAVTSVDGREKAFALLGPGDFFGELSLLDGMPRSAGAVAVRATRLHVLYGGPFLSFLRAHPDACLKVMTALSLRLRRTDELVQDASFLDVPGRLAKVILHLAEGSGERVGRGAVISPRMSQAEIATLVGATRESVNKWLRFYQGKGLLRFEHGIITVPDLHMMRQEAFLRTGEAPLD